MTTRGFDEAEAHTVGALIGDGDLQARRRGRAGRRSRPRCATLLDAHPLYPEL